MRFNHHLSDDTLISYAAGNSLSHMSLVIASHLDQCAYCQDKYHEMIGIGAALIESQPSLELAPDALEKTLARLEVRESSFQGAPIRRISENQGPPSLPDSDTPEIPRSLARFLPKSGLSDVPWKNLAPGIKTFALSEICPDRGTARLLKIAPGMQLPLHDHEGDELTLILKGSYSDEIGRFKPGDIADLQEGVQHQPISDSDSECICLIATEGPLRFKAMMPKIVQYFIGI